RVWTTAGKAGRSPFRSCARGAARVSLPGQRARAARPHRAGRGSRVLDGHRRRAALPPARSANPRGKTARAGPPAAAPVGRRSPAHSPGHGAALRKPVQGGGLSRHLPVHAQTKAQVTQGQRGARLERGRLARKGRSWLAGRSTRDANPSFFRPVADVPTPWV